MTTRRWLALVTALALLGITVAPEAVARGPNVVLIIADDQAWTDYSFMGHPQVRTPRIDRLAAEGLTFRRGYVPSSLCSPSLASILTGLYPHQHRVTSNDPPLPAGKTGQAANRDPGFRAQREEMIGFFDKAPTLPRLLAGQGYTSFQAGKWWGGNYRHGGFDAGMTHGDPDARRPARRRRPDDRPHNDDAGLRLHRRRGRDGKPFFVWYAPMMPHSPHTPPARLLDKYRGQAPTLEVAKYWAMIEWFDETCGQLLDHLDAKGLADDTMVVYLADNGWIQDPDADRYAPKSKQSPYDGGLRTPIIVRWPGKVQPKAVGPARPLPRPRATVLAAAGLKPPPETAGRRPPRRARRRAPQGDLRRDLHPQRRRHPSPRLQPPLPLGRRG